MSLTSLPACAQSCIESELDQASVFGCAATNATCLCKNADFGYGIRDCSNEACPSSADADQAISWAESYCAAALGSNNSTSSSGQASVSTAQVTTYTIYTTTGFATLPVNGTLQTTTYTLTDTITDSSVFASLESRTLSLTSTSSGSSSSTPAATSTPNSGNEGGDSGGLSTSAKIGIGVGITLGILLILGILVLLFIRRRRHNRSQGGGTHSHSLIGGGGAGQPGTPNRGLSRLYNSRRSELSGRPAPTELDAAGQTQPPMRQYELRGDDGWVMDARGKEANVGGGGGVTGAAASTTDTGTHSSVWVD